MTCSKTVLEKFNIQESKDHHDATNVIKIFPDSVDYQGWKFGIVQFNKRAGMDSFNLCYLDKDGKYYMPCSGHPNEAGAKILLKNVTKGNYDAILIDAHKIKNQ